MENKELEEKIITVMKFDGWKAMKNPEKPDVIWHHSKYGHIYSDYDITDFTYYHTSWEWIHSAWEKFRDFRHNLSGLSIRDHYEHSEKIGFDISYGTELQAFTALYEGIVWFNGLNKEG